MDNAIKAVGAAEGVIFRTGNDGGYYRRNVGEINDEYDEDERQYVRLNANTYVFEAKVLLTDFFRIMKLDDDFFEEVEGEADTLAGFCWKLKVSFRNFMR